MFGRRSGGARLPIGNTEPICPYCDQRLEKRPARKKKCPHCGNFIYVRTRPSDRKKVLVTEEQTEQIAEQWSIVHGTHGEYLARRKRFEDAKRELTRDGVEPSNGMVEYHLLNQAAMEHARFWQMGLYRNAILGMADVLRKEGRLEDALAKYLQACYIDLNGPCNTGTLVDRRGRSTSLVSRDNPPWDPGKWGEVLPAITGHVQRLIEQTGSSPHRTREAFMHGAQGVQGLRPPISPEKAWETIKDDLAAG